MSGVRLLLARSRIPDYWIADGDAVRYELAGVRQARHLPLTFTAAG